jgi:hypothetical protein
VLRCAIYDRHTITITNTNNSNLVVSNIYIPYYILFWLSIVATITIIMIV